MGKASKRKKRGFENRDAQGSDFGEAVLPSIFIRYSFLITLFLITVTAFLIYSNTFSSPFQFDDTPNIVENYKLRDLSNFWPPSGTRYIGFLSFAINYHFGNLNVFGYHLLNIIIHIINSLLVWWLVVLTFKTPAMRIYVGQGFSPALSKPEGLPYLSALTVSLIFVSHPIQTQAVTYIVQRFASLSTLFYILSLALYIKARLPYQNTELRTQGTEKKQKVFSLESVFCYLLSVFSAILAMKTKEIGFTLPFIIILYEFMFFSHAYATPVSPDLRLRGQASTGQALKGCPAGKEAIVGQGFSPAKRIAYLVPFLLTLLIIPLSLIGTDKPVGDIIGELREAAQETEAISRGAYLLTQFKVIVTYIRLLFLPINQNLDYDYPLSHSLFEPATFLSFIFLLSIFVFAIYLLSRNSHPASRIISFGLLWFFITLSVESSIIPIRDVIFEHRLYLPSVGAVIAFSSAFLYGISYAKERLDIKVSLLVATCILILATAFPLGVAAYKRNFIWKDEITLWEDVVRKSPDKARGHSNIGKFLQDRGRFGESIRPLQKAIELNSNYPEAHNNLGNAYINQRQTDEAIKEYREALRQKPDYPEAHSNLGVAYAKKGLLDMAIEEFITALSLKSDYLNAHFNLGLTYQRKALKNEAIMEFKEVLKIQPDYIEVQKIIELLSKQ